MSVISKPLSLQPSTTLEAALKARMAYRQGLVVPTAGVAPGVAQANMIALPHSLAWDFLLFAQRNPKACPILDVIEAGRYDTFLAEGADIRTDIPLYRVWRHGEMVQEVSDVRALWGEHSDLVTFLIGCSFTFEAPLQQAGIVMRHIDEQHNVAMYKTNRACRPAGRLQGNMVVSMRPIPAHQVAQACTITGHYPQVHGSPVHVGDPAALGIVDIHRPDFGDPVRIEPGEVPVFWACGVTPQAVVMASKVPFAITHAPGHMFVTDVADIHYQG